MGIVDSVAEKKAAAAAAADEAAAAAAVAAPAAAAAEQTATAPAPTAAAAAAAPATQAAPRTWPPTTLGEAAHYEAWRKLMASERGARTVSYTHLTLPTNREV